MLLNLISHLFIFLRYVVINLRPAWAIREALAIEESNKMIEQSLKCNQPSATT